MADGILVLVRDINSEMKLQAHRFVDLLIAGLQFLCKLLGKGL